MIAPTNSTRLREDLFPVYIEERGLSHGAAVAFHHALQRFSTCLGRSATIADLSDENVLAFAAWLLNEKGYAAATVHRTVSYLLVIWRHAHGKGCVETFPRPVPNLVQREPKPRPGVPPVRRGRKPESERNSASTPPLPMRPPGISQIGQGQALFELFYDMYMPMRIRGRSAPTTLQHRIALRHFDRFLNRKATIGDLNNETVTAFGTWLADGTREAITVNKTVEKVLAQWRFYNRRGIVSTWPDVMALPEVERVPEAWLPDELARLFAACKAQEGDIVGVPAGLWWLGLHYAIYDTAERIGAVRAIEWRNVDLAGGWVRFPGGTRKGGKRDIVRRLHPDTVAHLRTMIEPKRECVFPWPWDTSLLYFMYERVLRAAGLPWDRRCKFHKLRRTVASMYHQAGGDPTAFLDHSSRKVTQAYLDPRIVQTPQAADLLPRVSIR